jgi:hypothetical protein
MIANIASDDALILPHRANPAGLNFRERQALICADTPDLCAILALCPTHGDGECAESCEIVVHTACTAPRGELLRINDYFHNDIAARAHFRKAFVGRLFPLIERGRQLCIADETPDSFVIFSAEQRDISSSHSPSSFASVESALLSA